MEACPCGSRELGASRIRLTHRGASYGLRPCRGCGRSLLDPSPSPEALLGCYDTAYYGVGARKFVAPIEAGVEWFRRKRAEAVLAGAGRRGAAAGRPPRVLDLGCGSGAFLARLAARGCECHGTELTPVTAQRARAVPGLALRTGPLTQDAYPDAHFDVISLWHVLEHLPDPDAALRACRRWLAPGGVLLLAVPNLESWQARLFRGAWFHLDPPFHLFHYGTRSLRGCLEANGFRQTAIVHLCWQYNPYGFVQSFLNAAGFPRDEFYEWLKGNHPRTRPRLLAQAALALGLLPAATLATLLEAAFRRGGTIEVTALAAEGGPTPA